MAFYQDSVETPSASLMGRAFDLVRPSMYHEPAPTHVLAGP